MRVALAQRVEIFPERRQDDHVGVFQFAVDRQYHLAEAAHRLAVRADQAGFEYRLEAQAHLLAIAQAGQVEKILGLGKGRSEDLIGRQDADASQRRGVRGKHHFFILIWDSGQLAAGSSYFLALVSSVPRRNRGLVSVNHSRFTQVPA
ncbi:hypothetical protein D3C81_1314340 [compost metagenome]